MMPNLTAHRLRNLAGLFLFASVAGCEPDDPAPKLDSAREATGPTTNTCSEQEAKLRTQLAEHERELRTAKHEADDQRHLCESIKAENEQLKQTARYHFDQAVAGLDGDTDDTDQEAIEKLEKLTERFPDDLLVGHSKKKIVELRKRIKRRAADLRRAQAKVRSLIKKCRSYDNQGERAEQSGMSFNALGNLNMNRALAASRRAEGLYEKARKAKEQAEELLDSGRVPDPDGKLRGELRECDD